VKWGEEDGRNKEATVVHTDEKRDDYKMVEQVAKKLDTLFLYFFLLHFLVIFLLWSFSQISDTLFVLHYSGWIRLFCFLSLPVQVFSAQAERKRRTPKKFTFIHPAAFILWLSGFGLNGNTRQALKL